MLELEPSEVEMEAGGGGPPAAVATMDLFSDTESAIVMALMDSNRHNFIFFLFLLPHNFHFGYEIIILIQISYNTGHTVLCCSLQSFFAGGGSKLKDILKTD